MRAETTPEMRTAANREKRMVAISSVIAAIVLTLMKLIVGLSTNSLGILSEAAHSGLDLVAAMITFWAVCTSSQPADSGHPYGHGKFENFSALVETLLLLVTCAWIVYESVHRLFFAGSLDVKANGWAFLVVMVSIGVDFSRSRALRKAAHKLQSQALEADALHFSTDIWSSLVVFVGLVGVLLSKRFDLPWLIQADSIAALGVALIVIGVSFKLGKKSLDDLLDSVPSNLTRDVVSAAAGVPGVEDVINARVRKSGAEVFADMTLTVDRTIAFEKAHEIADSAEKAIRSVVDHADVVVHVEPVPAEHEDIVSKIRVLALRHGIVAHSIRMYQEGEHRSLELHLEVEESLTLGEAHRLATAVEQSIYKEIPELSRVVTHLEPAGDASAIRQCRTANRQEIEKAIQDFCRDTGVELSPHNLEVQQSGDETVISFHCTLEADMAITYAHDLTERLEKYLRERVAHVGRVLIHMEPP